MAPTKSILQLSEQIAASAAKLNQVLTAKGLQAPSFHEDNTFSVPAEASDARDAILDAAAELQDLLLDPMTLIHSHGAVCASSRKKNKERPTNQMKYQHNNSLCQQVISHFGIAAMVPSGGRISFADIAKQTPLTEQMVGRILRHAMTMRIFYEPEPGMVGHTKASKILVDPITNDWLRVGTEEMWSASTKASIASCSSKWYGANS